MVTILCHEGNFFKNANELFYHEGPTQHYTIGHINHLEHHSNIKKLFLRLIFIFEIY
jgi:hypothetical protein